MHPIGNRIRATRKLVDDLSADELSALVGVSRSYIALLETGARKMPGGDVAVRIARVLGCSIEYLVDGAGDAPSAEDVRAAIERARAAKAEPNGPAAA